MPGRRLGAEERALWARVIESVKPIAPARPEPVQPPPAPVKIAVPKSRPHKIQPAVPPPPAKLPPKPAPSNTLDGSWDRKLGRGIVTPDFAVDLHGHTLESAYRLLDTSLESAIRDGVRVVLLITGKAPKSQSHGGPPKRGLIRAAVGDWIAFSRHGSAIAAVRNAHPRHGGAGALYIILKRSRTAS